MAARRSSRLSTQRIAAGLGFRQLDIELETRVAGPVGARQHVVGAQARADLLQRGVAPAEGGRRQARYELEVRRMGKPPDDLLGEDFADHARGRCATLRDVKGTTAIDGAISSKDSADPTIGCGPGGPTL